MTRNIKTLGLALVAVFAMSAMAAGSASANNPGEFTLGSHTTYLTAETDKTTPNNVFSTTAGSVTCNEVHGHAAVSGASVLTTIKTTAIKYGHAGLAAETCTGPFGTTPKIEMNGCQYEFHATTNLTVHQTTGTATIICEAGKKIKINAPGCVIEVGSQNPGGHVIFINETNTPHSVTATATVTGISYNHSGFLCGTGSAANGTYNGSFTIRGFTDSTRAVQTAITVS